MKASAFELERKLADLGDGSDPEVAGALERYRNRLRVSENNVRRIKKDQAVLIEDLAECQRLLADTQAQLRQGEQGARSHRRRLRRCWPGAELAEQAPAYPGS